MTEHLECGCRLVRCDNPDCGEAIYNTDGVCRACAAELCPSFGCEFPAGHDATFEARFERQLVNTIKEKRMDRRIKTEARLLVTGEMVEAAYAVTGAVDQADSCLYASTLRHAIEAALAVAPFDVPYTAEPYPGTPGQHTKLVEVDANA